MEKISSITPFFLQQKSIENKDINNKDIKYSYNSIDSIPEEIDSLIDNKMFRNKFKSLIKRGFILELQELAQMAHTKEKPSHWFAKVTAKAAWEETLKFLKKVKEVSATVGRLIEKIKPAKKYVGYTKYLLEKLGNKAEYIADMSVTGKSRPRLFCYLAKLELRNGTL